MFESLRDIAFKVHMESSSEIDRELADYFVSGNFYRRLGRFTSVAAIGKSGELNEHLYFFKRKGETVVYKTEDVLEKLGYPVI